MIPWLREHFGNPASRSHAWGWEAEAAVEKAREQVAAAFFGNTSAASTFQASSMVVANLTTSSSVASTITVSALAFSQLVVMSLNTTTPNPNTVVTYLSTVINGTGYRIPLYAGV